MFTEVHRQALESPIIRLATDIRSGGRLKRGKEEGLSVYQGNLTPDQALRIDQFLTGKNATRRKANQLLRKLQGKTGEFPQEDERIICLRNNRKVGLFNGLICHTDEEAELIDPNSLGLTFTSELDREYTNLEAHTIGFTDEETLMTLPYRERAQKEEFTWGYCITGHKSQGSQWDSVCIVDDGFLGWKQEDRKKWLYTCVTRAAEELTIVRDR